MSAQNSILMSRVQRIRESVNAVSLISETLRLKRHGGVHVACCPFHGEKTPSFTVYPNGCYCFGCGARGDVLDWLMKTRGTTLGEAVDHLDGGALSDRPKAASVQPMAAPDSYKAANNLRAAAHTWRGAQPPSGTPAEVYVHSCGGELPDPYRFADWSTDASVADVLRYHPACPCGDETRPAMVCLMTDPLTGKPTGIHRTFLKPDGSGKAEIERPKQMLGGRGAIRLYPFYRGGLGLTEGIENALSVAQHIWHGPTWAASTAGGIGQFPVLPDTCLNVFADRGKAGENAAVACRVRWLAAGEEAIVRLPPKGGADWNDLVRRRTGDAA